jgi:hypothetical protein
MKLNRPNLFALVLLAVVILGGATPAAEPVPTPETLPSTECGLENSPFPLPISSQLQELSGSEAQVNLSILTECEQDCNRNEMRCNMRCYRTCDDGPGGEPADPECGGACEEDCAWAANQCMCDCGSSLCY